MLFDLMVKKSAKAFPLPMPLWFLFSFLLFRDLLHQAEEIVKLMKENQVCLKHRMIRKAWCEAEKGRNVIKYFKQHSNLFNLQNAVS